MNLISAVTNCIFVMLLAVGLGGIQGSDQDQVALLHNTSLFCLSMCSFVISFIFFLFKAMFCSLSG